MSHVSTQKTAFLITKYRDIDYNLNKVIYLRSTWFDKFIIFFICRFGKESIIEEKKVRQYIGHVILGYESLIKFGVI